MYVLDGIALYTAGPQSVNVWNLATKFNVGHQQQLASGPMLKTLWLRSSKERKQDAKQQSKQNAGKRSNNSDGRIINDVIVWRQDSGIIIGEKVDTDKQSPLRHQEQLIVFCGTTDGIVALNHRTGKVTHQWAHSINPNVRSTASSTVTAWEGEGDAPDRNVNDGMVGAAVNNVMCVSICAGFLFSAAYDVRQWNPAPTSMQCLRVFPTVNSPLPLLNLTVVLAAGKRKDSTTQQDIQVYAQTRQQAYCWASEAIGKQAVRDRPKPMSVYTQARNIKEVPSTGQ
jgi:hypothetical protein